MGICSSCSEPPIQYDKKNMIATEFSGRDVPPGQSLSLAGTGIAT
jgi:hypothetical protein